MKRTCLTALCVALLLVAGSAPAAVLDEVRGAKERANDPTTRRAMKTVSTERVRFDAATDATETNLEGLVTPNSPLISKTIPVHSVGGVIRVGWISTSRVVGVVNAGVGRTIATGQMETGINLPYVNVDARFFAVVMKCLGDMNSR